MANQDQTQPQPQPQSKPLLSKEEQFKMLISWGTGTLPIVNGPGKWDLITKFANREKLVFKFMPPDSTLEVPMLVEAIEHEDGSGDSWNLQTQIEGVWYRLYFTSKRREGTISKMAA